MIVAIGCDKRADVIRCLPGILVALLSFFGSKPAAAITLGGRDYTPLSQIASANGMAAPTKIASKAYGAAGGGKSIRVKVNSRDAIVNGIRSWLAFPALERGGQAYISDSDVEHVLKPAFKPGSVDRPGAVRTVVLDAGHGGHDRGASGPTGYEKEFTLDVVLRLKKRLEKAGFKVVLTRSSDRFVDLADRPAIASKYKNAIFVSIHFNSADWKRSANGLEVFAITARNTPPTGQKNIMSRDRTSEAGHRYEGASAVFAGTMLHSLLGAMDSYDRGVKRARFAVLRRSTVPAILIEGGFLTNPAEARKIGSASWRDNYADAITRGIVEFAAWAGDGRVPRTVTQYGGKPTTQFVPED